MIKLPDQPLVSFDAAVDIVKLTIGELVGSGVYRDVYDYLPVPEYVIKVAKDTGGINHNFREFSTYDALSLFHQEYFAKIIDISASGHIIRQVKAAPLDRNVEYDCILPKLADIHYWNIGIIEDRVVIVDLGFPFVHDIVMHHVKIHHDTCSIEWGEKSLIQEPTVCEDITKTFPTRTVKSVNLAKPAGRGHAVII